MNREKGVTEKRHREAALQTSRSDPARLLRHAGAPFRNDRADLGFTLIEILLVVMIMGILVSLVAPRLAGRAEDARKQAAHADIDGGISIALDLYEVDIGRYPVKIDDLVQKPAESQNWKGPYLKKGPPTDPWGSAYAYRFPGLHNLDSYDLFSPGPDKQEGSGDDINNWVPVPNGPG